MEERNYFVQKIKQRNAEGSVEFALFVADAKDIMQWAGIKRVGAEEQGTQRVLKDTRVKAIKRFLESNPINTIPVSVILAFNPNSSTYESVTQRLIDTYPERFENNEINAKGDIGLLHFEFNPEGAEADRPALIVDGQHRVNGMAEVDDEAVPVVVAALLNADPQEQAFQFVVINNKAQKVRTDNVKAIIRAINEETLQTRLLQAGVNYGKYPATLGDVDGLADSPFFHLLNWPLNPTANKRIELTTIESCMRYIRDTFQIIEDDDSQKLIFIWAWRGVREHYEALWLNNERFMSKVNIVALNEYILDKLENAWLDNNFDIYNVEEISAYTKTILEPIPADFWIDDWVYQLQDNATVRTAIKDDLRKIPQNVKAGRGWNKGLKLVGE